MLGDGAYNVVKKSATIVLPALATLYFALAQLWNFPEPEKVVASITALNTFLGVLVQISKKSYYASNAPYVGEIKVEDSDDGSRKVFSLVVNGDPEDLETMDVATFKVNNDTGSNPIVKP
ncbi:holin [Streptomyces phage Bing]|uniref:Holin n=1 Tax=Streptomyces phage Bing TaxID=2079427 RepID=A0A2L1IWA9_9CAUD|nr:holin [Streptomyces phage Bing]AVD99452.1 holin [Streptomyces phage Bing]